jgi:hypothetical protein
MRSARLAALLTIVFAALVVPSGAATHRVVLNGAASAHRCSRHGTPLAMRTISARDVTCATARAVVIDWFHRLKAPGGHHCVVPDGGTNPAVCTVGSWRCSSDHTVNGQTYPVTCARWRRRVHFVNLV